MYECLFFPTYKYQTNNNRYQRQSISSTPHPKQYTVDCLHNISEKCTSIHIPQLYIYSPSQNCLLLCVLLFDLLTASYDVDCYYDTIVPRSTTAVSQARRVRQQHIVVFIVLAVTMTSLRRRHGNWYELHDAVDCCVALINWASMVCTRRPTTHDNRCTINDGWYIIIIVLLLLLVVVVLLFLSVCICYEKMKRQKFRDVISTTNKSKQGTYHRNAMSTAMALSLQL